MNIKKACQKFGSFSNENKILKHLHFVWIPASIGGSYIYISTFSCVRKFIFSHMKMLGGGALLQNGEFLYIFCRRLSTSLDFVKLFFHETRLYSASAATNRMSGKNLWAEIFKPKAGNLGHFCVFFEFSPLYSKNTHHRRKFLS